MALKKRFYEHERYGLTTEEIKKGEKYLRKHKTAGAIPEQESLKLYELYMIGCSFYDIHQQYPQYPVEQIILTAALRQWPKDRDKMMSSLKDRVQARVVKSVIEQVDFLTTMLSVTNAEHMAAMRKFVLDPENNPPPKLRPQSIKEYRETVDALYKLVSGAVSGDGKGKTKTSPLFGALDPKNYKDKPAIALAKQRQEEEDDVAAIIAGEIVEEDK